MVPLNFKMSDPLFYFLLQLWLHKQLKFDFAKHSILKIDVAGFCIQTTWIQKVTPPPHLRIRTMRCIQWQF
jgi:hypothetical protein